MDHWPDPSLIQQYLFDNWVPGLLAALVVGVTLGVVGLRRANNRLLVAALVVLLVGGLFVGITFSASVFALPMIMHRNVDAITAALTSVNSVMHNKLAMLIWILMIMSGFLIGVLTAGFGLIFFLPAVGHAVWHGYLDTIDAQQFPRHQEGITAIPRLDSKGRERFRSYKEEDTYPDDD